MITLCLAFPMFILPVCDDNGNGSLPDLSHIKIGSPLPEDLPLSNRTYFARNDWELVAGARSKAPEGDPCFWRVYVCLFADSDGMIIGKHVFFADGASRAVTATLEFLVPEFADHAPEKPTDECLQFGLRLARPFEDWRDAPDHEALWQACCLPNGIEPCQRFWTLGRRRAKELRYIKDDREKVGWPARIDEYACYVGGWFPRSALQERDVNGKLTTESFLIPGFVLIPSLTLVFKTHDLSGIRAEGFDRALRSCSGEDPLGVRITHLEDRVYRTTFVVTAVQAEDAGESVGGMGPPPADPCVSPTPTGPPPADPCHSAPTAVTSPACRTST